MECPRSRIDESRVTGQSVFAEIPSMQLRERCPADWHLDYRECVICGRRDACFRAQFPVRSFLAGKNVTTIAYIRSRELGSEGGTSSEKNFGTEQEQSSWRLWLSLLCCCAEVLLETRIVLRSAREILYTAVFSCIFSVQRKSSLGCYLRRWTKKIFISLPGFVLSPYSSCV